MFSLDRHAYQCKSVKRAKAKLDQEDKELRDEPGDGLFTPANPFETSVGHFWGILSTRDYMRARYGLVQAILEIKTFEATEAAANHLRDMLRLCRSDNMGVRGLLPALYLRLDRDQEAYDFIKWYETTGNESNYDWGNLDLPFLDVVNADVFESPNYITTSFPSLTNLLCTSLIKIKILIDLRYLRNSAFLEGTKLPRELVDKIRYFIPSSSIVRKNNKILSTTNHDREIAKLSDQAGFLFDAVHRYNKYFWPALLDPMTHLQAQPESYGMGSKEEMQMMLQHIYDSWNETPGTIDFIHKQLTMEPSAPAKKSA
ncbi:MAG: hypothetical protein Q9219_001567 [cf. Caloplaca sp. 3 TL-2023]